MIMELELTKILKELASKYENDDFLKEDPSWFMHQVAGWENQETMAFLASCLSYGSRKQFFPKIQQFLDWSGGEVYDWVIKGAFKSVVKDDSNCFYRLQTNHNMLMLLCRMQMLLKSHCSIRGYIAEKTRDTKDALLAIKAICNFFNGSDNGALVPANASSACKRVCMFLRWMVRDNSPVDLGIWKGIIDKRTLIMPLDTHVVQEATKMGLLNTKSTSMSTAVRLTEKMKEIFPDDPLKGDFALFGLGVDNIPKR